MKFDIHGEVRVRLTDAGRDRMKRQHLLVSGSKIKYRPLPEDSEGWSEWRLIDLMLTFGLTHDAVPCMYEPVVDIPSPEVTE